MNSVMQPKYMIPLPLRHRLRPAWQRLKRRWAESPWSPKPLAWMQARERAWSESNLEILLQIAADEFGITQVKSEIISLLEILHDLAPRNIVEVGTHKGGNSFLFCHALPSVHRVVGVDLCVQNAPKLIHFAKPGQLYGALHGDSQTDAMLGRVRKQLHGQSIDFLFIDGDHSYQGVSRDFNLYAPLVRPGGIIALHDIVPDYRTRFGRDTGCYTGEVYLFWEELKRRYDCCELIDQPDQDGFGIGVVRIPSVEI